MSHQSVLHLIRDYIPGIVGDQRVRAQVEGGEFTLVSLLLPGDVVDMSHAVTFHHRALGYQAHTRASDIHESHRGFLEVSDVFMVPKEWTEIGSVDVTAGGITVTVPELFPVRVVDSTGIDHVTGAPSTPRRVTDKRVFDFAPVERLLDRTRHARTNQNQN